MEYYATIEIPSISCVTSTTTNLYVGTLKPSLILMELPLLRKDQEYPLNSIAYQKKNRFPWLQDMKVVENSILCLFTGSPYPIQMFSLRGTFLMSIITANQLSGAYHFNVFRNPVTAIRYIYITDFWENVVN